MRRRRRGRERGRMACERVRHRQRQRRRTRSRSNPRRRLTRRRRCSIFISIIISLVNYISLNPAKSFRLVMSLFDTEATRGGGAPTQTKNKKQKKQKNIKTKEMSLTSLMIVYFLYSTTIYNRGSRSTVPVQSER